MTGGPPKKPEDVSSEHVEDATVLAREVEVNVLGIVGNACWDLFLLFAEHSSGDIARDWLDGNSTARKHLGQNYRRA